MQYLSATCGGSSADIRKGKQPFGNRTEVKKKNWMGYSMPKGTLTLTAYCVILKKEFFASFFFVHCLFYIFVYFCFNCLCPVLLLSFCRTVKLLSL